MKISHLDQLIQYLETGEYDLSNPDHIFHRGFGSLKALLLDPANTNMWPPNYLKFHGHVQKIHAGIHKKFPENSQQVIAALKRSSLSSFFTPQPIVDSIYSLLPMDRIKYILDPSAGTGNFIRSGAHQDLTMIEPDPLAYQILKDQHPEATVFNQKLEDAQLESYDLIISNIPFGDIKAIDFEYLKHKDPVIRKSIEKIHNYFFVKCAQHLTQNGLLVFITSSAFMDTPANEEFRKYVASKLNLLGAIRLPGETFKTSGTFPTTDVLFLQNGATQSNPSWIKSNPIEIGDHTVNLNQYYHENTSHLIGDPTAKGQYGNITYNLTTKLDLDQIADQIKQFDFINSENGNDQITAVTSSRETKPEPTAQFSAGNLCIKDNMTVLLNEDGTVTKYPKIQPLLTHQIIEIRLAYLKMLDALENNQDTTAAQRELNYQYDLFKFRYGTLTSQKSVIQLDKDAHLILSLENHGEKADIFEGKQKQIKPQKVDNLEDAVLLSLNKFNQISINYLTDLLEKDSTQIINEGVNKSILFLEKKGPKWQLVTKDIFISGDVKKKLSHVEKDFPVEHDTLKELHISILKAHCPAHIPFEDIDINLGERWLPSRLYDAFLTHLFEVPTTAKYIYSWDKFSIDLKETSPLEEVMSVRGKSSYLTGKKLVEHAFADTTPNITYTIRLEDREIKKTDVEAVQQAQNKIAEIHQNFENWLNNHSEWSEFIEKEYNEKFNDITPRIYDGSHLKFPTIESFEPYDTQLNATYRVLQTMNGLCDHIVGAGKTLTMAMAAHEMIRLNLASKILVTVKNANISSIYQEFIKSFPTLKILYPTPSDFKPANRRILFQKIINNNWDVVIITHEQFKMIPQSLEMIKAILEDEISALESDLRVFLEETRSQESIKQLKGLEKRKANLESRLAEIVLSIKRDPYIIDFEKMDFDFLMVDESHEFKNLQYTTRHKGVAGLGNPAGSQRAFNLLIAARTLQKRYNDDKGVLFLSGTPISNSLVELYLIFKYLCPNKLKALNINSFDAWAKVYARKSTEFEFSITNEIKAKERYREFIKVPELANFYTQIADVVNDENFKQDKPKLKNHMMNLKPTPDQEHFISCLIDFAKTKDGDCIGIGDLTENQKMAFMLIATNYAKKMSLDMRTIDPFLEAHPLSKIEVCAKNIAQIYERTTPFKGTQLVFCDLSVPNSDNWNAYGELRSLLIIKYNIPAHEIAFIHDVKNSKQKQLLFDKTNGGDVRVIVGSTIKLGTGTNVQKRIVAMHQLDTPWRPSDFGQRVGRGVRPGNVMAKKYNDNYVDNYIYAVERSLDSYQFNLLAAKQKFIDQIRDNSVKSRRIDEGSMSGDGGEQQMNFSEYVAILSGDTDLLAKTKIDKQIKTLQMLKRSFSQSQRQLQYDIKSIEKSIEQNQNTLAKLNTDYQSLIDFEAKPDEFEIKEKRFHYPRPVVINGMKLHDSHQVGLHLLNGCKAQYGEFKFEVEVFGDAKVTGPSGIKYTYSNGALNSNPTLAGSYINRALTKFDSLIATHQQVLTNEQNRLPVYKSKLQDVWPEEQKLKDLQDESDRLTKLLMTRDEKKEDSQELKMPA